MEELIAPVDKELLKAELTQECFFRDTNRAGNKIYIVDNTTAPNVLREVGRLREMAFREYGGGSGKATDLDEFDLDPAYRYKQMVLWDPEAECIVGGYRFVLGDDFMYDHEGQPITPSSHMFTFTRKFLKEKILQTIELSRSFVALEYQSTREDSKSLYALDNLFDGVASLILLYGDRMKYFFGKMTIYPSFPKEALNMLLYFLRKHFGTRKEKWIITKNPVKIGDSSKYKDVFTEKDFKEDYKILKREIQKFGVNIPPLVNTYMNMSPTMLYFGTGINYDFGDIIDSGILLAFDELHPEKVDRHMKMPESHWPHIEGLKKRISLRLKKR